MLGQNGIIEKSKEAVEKYKKAEEDEENAIDKMKDKLEKLTIDYNDYVGCYVEGYKPDTKKITITPITSGAEDDVNTLNQKIESGNISKDGIQEFETETNMKWRIWDYNENTKTIRIISEKPTDKMLTLEGRIGYSNGVWAINEICRRCYGQYNDNGKMKDGIKVANLRRSDIQKISNYDYTNFIYESGNWVEFTGSDTEDKNLKHFGESKDYTNCETVPKMWCDYDSKWKYKYEDGVKTGGEEECLIWERENNETGTLPDEKGDVKDYTFRTSYYYHDYINKENEFKNEKYYDLLFLNKENEEFTDWRYWLSGRYTTVHDTHCSFGICTVVANSSKKIVSGNDICYQNRTQGSCFNALRPIISIDLRSSGYELEKIVNDDGTTYFKLIKN